MTTKIPTTEELDELEAVLEDVDPPDECDLLRQQAPALIAGCREAIRLKERLTTIIDEAFGLQPVYASSEEMMTALQGLIFVGRLRESRALNERDRLRTERALIGRLWAGPGARQGKPRCQREKQRHLHLGRLALASLDRCHAAQQTEAPMKRLLLEFLHHCVAHPALFFTGDAQWAVVLHDWTAPSTSARR